jgi:hypothetical protein
MASTTGPSHFSTAVADCWTAHGLPARLLFTKKSSQEPWFFGVVCVTLALLGLRNSAHYLGHVLAAARPGCLSAFATGYFLAHFVSSALVIV